MSEDTALAVLCGLAMIVGLVGIVIPFLPGLVLCWGGVAAWAFLADRGSGKWVVLGIATAIAVLGWVVKYAWPGRNLRRGGVHTMSLLLGAVLGIVGFFVVPVVGLPLGFIFGIWLAEFLRYGNGRQAWAATKHALKAVGLSMLIELTAGLFIAAVWILGLLLT